ncbi:MAG: thioredoxin family protein [Microscillaceae bacterium]|nr:thioredoxin family protein [Microscillaceae bacterium]
MKNLVLLIILVLVSTATDYKIHVYENLEWVTDYAAALKKAKKENKALLLNFTGSDWCGWCVRLDREVFSQSAFVAYAQKNLVCVKLDFPQKKQLPAAEQEQNMTLMRKYGVRGFPTIYLLNASEETVLKTGYRSGGAQAYISHLEAALEAKN